MRQGTRPSLGWGLGSCRGSPHPVGGGWGRSCGPPLPLSPPPPCPPLPGPACRFLWGSYRGCRAGERGEQSGLAGGRASSKALGARIGLQEIAQSLVVDVVVGYAQDADGELSEDVGAFSVVLTLGRVIVDAAVE